VKSGYQHAQPEWMCRSMPMRWSPCSSWRITGSQDEKKCLLDVPW
jgi:hypothetical protein